MKEEIREQALEDIRVLRKNLWIQKKDFDYESFLEEAEKKLISEEISDHLFFYWIYRVFRKFNLKSSVKKIVLNEDGLKALKDLKELSDKQVHRHNFGTLFFDFLFMHWG